MEHKSRADDGEEADLQDFSGLDTDLFADREDEYLILGLF